MFFSGKSIAGDSIKLYNNTHFTQIQYAGNFGLGSVGFGKSFFSDKASLCLIYGYLPKEVNNVSVHTHAFKAAFNLKQFQVFSSYKISLYTGFSVLYGMTHNTFIKLPNQYPDNYYYPTALHATLFTGIKFTKFLSKSNWLNSVSVFTELGTIDYKFYYAIKTDYIDYADILNFSVGISFGFCRN
jgi:hypothetical protein